MKVVVIGAGSIGVRQATLLHRLVAPEILIVEPDAGRRAAFLRAVPARPLESLDLALDEHPDAAIICSPTSMHVPHCLRALRADCHVLLEKPISNNLDDVNLLRDEARSRERVVLVSCNFRFDPALSQMKEWIQSGLVGRVLTCRASYGQDLRQCRPGRDYRTVYASNKAMGGGILLDSVHEIDYLSWFFGPVESVSAVTGKLSDLEMDTEDSANLLLRFKSGPRGLVQLDYFRPEYNRSCEVIGTEGILQWSYSPKTMRYFSCRSGLWSTRALDDDGATDNMYSQQLRHFLGCIAGEKEPAQSIDDAANTLDVVLSAARSAECGREVAISTADRQAARCHCAGTAVPMRGPTTATRIVTIIQARVNSKRLPGKVLVDICGKPMLARVIERVRSAKSAGVIIVATTSNPADDPIASLCTALGVVCFRGSEYDVLDRYYHCAEEAGADVVIRITGDCPLTDPQLVDQMTGTFRSTGADYASNRRYGSPEALYSYPDGLDVEIFTFDALRCAQKEATSAYDREHVTPFIWRNLARFRVLFTQSSKEFHKRQWTVDYPEDLEFVRGIYARLQDGLFGVQSVLNILKENPELAAINEQHAPAGDWRYAPRAGAEG
jgi:spore coat polysaccharide biosynthesis protein SpsF (cytidylyltransferase family)/predicted dehydrogenase